MRLARPGRWRRLTLRGLLLLALSGAAFAALWIFFPYPAEKLDRFPAGVRIVDREGRLLRVYPSARGEFRFPVRLDEMSPWLLKATVAVEDRRFYSHPGADPLAVARAVFQNLKSGRVRSGASTITQQLVRILEDRPRTLWTKVVETFRALQLERQRTKADLLEAYMNLAPYGGNLRGVEAASLRYFGKRARELSLSEAALLAGLPQSPARLRPDRHYDRAMGRRRIVLEAMLGEGLISRGELEEALRDRPRVEPHPWPFRAPHFSDLVFSRMPPDFSRREALRTTLDPEIQLLAETKLSGLFDWSHPSKARLSGAALVIEVSTGAVRALVGSPDYFDLERRGALNGCLRYRSPGSALKPLLYALAFDRGVVGPESRLADTPAHYKGYLPENFDKTFRGPLPASEALSLSLNVPAVRLQETLGTEAVLEAFRRFGLEGLRRPARYYGLALSLGSCEVALADLANAYACLVRLGRRSPWRVIEGLDAPASQPAGDRVLSPGACRLVLEILSSERHLRRALPDWTGGDHPFLGYKTGTSFGLRDAWTVAFTADHVVGVWIGDPRGKGTSGLVGVETAAPVALGIAAELSRRGTKEIPGDPEAILEKRLVCALSGFPAGRSCPRTTESRFPRGSESPEPCTVHRTILVDVESGHEVCRACAGGRSVFERVVEAWPNDVELWFEREGIRRQGIPPAHLPSCRAIRDQGKPSILSPANNSEYLLARGLRFSQDLLLSAAAAPGTASLHWFVDGRLIEKARPAKDVRWSLQRGQHEIRCVDNQGRAAAVKIRVQ